MLGAPRTTSALATPRSPPARLPFDKIKIDGSFIKSVNINDQATAIVRSVPGLGRACGCQCWPSGVETTTELEFLESELCNEAQGYPLARPAISRASAS